MKILSRIIILALLSVFCACDKFHTSHNGALDGYWQLTTVDTLANGHSTDMKEKMIFWAVQTDLLEIRDLTNRQPHIIFHFKHDGNTLTLIDPVANNRVISDSIVTNPATLYYYGLSHLSETLQVLHLSSSNMTLQSERLRMIFRKY